MRSGSLPACLAATATLVLAPACQSTEQELNRVAKDWCLTIRASQVLPVYPLTEDLQPGDVFAVQTPLAKQTEIYQDRGFLPLDQHVVRLPAHGESDDAKDTPSNRLPYEEFYRDAYWTKAWEAPVARPGWDADGGAVRAPRSAFPSYTFSVQSGSGLQLAIPISGVPLGLGLMSASRATGSVTIDDAYTYGIDIQALHAALLAWWNGSGEIRETFAAIARSSDSEVYLRAVNRVFLTKGVTVSLQNLSSLGAGIDAGAAPEVKLLDLSTSDPEKAEASAEAYRATLEALSGSVPGTDAAPGGSFRLTQASQRSVTMDETFDRPLVIGYLGFDVRVEKDGSLSPPIPSFALLNDQASLPELDTTPAQAALEARWNALDAGQDERRLADALTAAAKELGGEFDETFQGLLASDWDVPAAFNFARIEYTGVESALEAERRLQEVIEVLDRALSTGGGTDA